MRDSFHNLIRLFESPSNRFDQLKNHNFLIENIDKFFKSLMEENYHWFVDFFQNVFLSYCCTDEPLEHLQLKIEDREKLWRLNNRFSSQKKVLNVTNLVNNQQNKPNSFESANLKDLFNTRELFFYYFITSVNNYCLSILILKSFSSKIYSIISSCENQISSSPSSLSQMIVQLKLLSKFIGLLNFWPNVKSFSKKPFSFPLKESLQILDNTNNFNFLDVFSIFCDSITNNNLTLTLPLILEYLKPISYEKLSRESKYYKKLIEFLSNLFLLIDLKNEEPLFKKLDFHLKFNQNVSIFLIFVLESFFHFVGIDPLYHLSEDTIAEIKILSEKNKKSSVDEEFDILDDTKFITVIFFNFFLFFSIFFFIFFIFFKK